MSATSIDPNRLQKARDDFAVALYRWAQADANDQALQGFPLFALLRDSMAAKYFRVYREMPADEQPRFITAMVKRTHERAVDLTGEVITNEEGELIRRFIDAPLFTDHDKRATGWERPRLTTGDRKRLAHLTAEFVKSEADGQYEEWSPNVFVNHRVVEGWTVSTSWEIKDKQNLSYEHRIFVQGRPDAVLKGYTSITRWLGIGETNWNLMLPGELEECSRSAMLVSRYFLERVPNILAGIRL
jgi:hypothetical protein